MHTRTLQVLRWVALVAVIAQVSRLEVEAGSAAGWPLAWALGIPFAVDAGVLVTLLHPRLRWWDRLGAIALLEAAVVLSVLHPNPKALGVGIVTALVLTLWRVEALIREAGVYVDEVTAETARWRARWRALARVLRETRQDLALANERIAMARVDLANLEERLRHLETSNGDLRRQLGEALTRPAGEPAGDRGGNGGDETGEGVANGGDPLATIATPDGQVQHLAAKLEHGWRGSWRDVQAMWPALSERDAQRRLTDARKARQRHGLTAIGGGA